MLLPIAFALEVLSFLAFFASAIATVVIAARDPNFAKYRADGVTGHWRYLASEDFRGPGVLRIGLRGGLAGVLIGTILFVVAIATR